MHIKKILFYAIVLQSSFAIPCMIYATKAQKTPAVVFVRDKKDVKTIALSCFKIATGTCGLFAIKNIYTKSHQDPVLSPIFGQLYGASTTELLPLWLTSIWACASGYNDLFTLFKKNNPAPIK